jgi:hypothetical protein
VTAEAIPRTVTQFAAVISSSGNVWDTYPTREAAQAFADAAPAPMHVAARQVTGDSHTRWVTA